jgi:hypothetical protein
MTDGIALEVALPLSWTIHQATSQANTEARRQGNIALLRALASIEAATPERDIENENTQKALERIESKLDIVMLLLAKLAGATGLMPAEKMVILRTDVISWVENGNLPAIAQTLLINVYLNPKLPQPLLLNGQVRDLQLEDDGTRVSVVLENVSDELEEWLTRTIFRYHRRQLQARRKP